MAMDIFTDPTKRAYIYRLILAAIPVLVVVGVITNEDAAVWLGLVAAIFGAGGAGLATANTSTKPPQSVDDL